MIIKAWAQALHDVPRANAVWAEDSILQFNRSDIGVAIAVEGGLVTPVVRSADTKSVADISRDVKDFAARARGKKLKVTDLQGGASAISNLGMYGVREFSAIINPPQSTVLAVGAVQRRPTETAEGGVRFATFMTVTLSCDHRVVDGALGAELLAALRDIVQQRALEVPGEKTQGKLSSATSSCCTAEFHPFFSPGTLASPTYSPSVPCAGFRRLGRPAFHLQHPLLRRRAAGCGEPADLAARRQHPMTRDDQRHRISRHGLADVAGRFRSGAELLGERAVRRRLSPADAARGGVDLHEELVLRAEVERHVREVHLLAGEVALRSFDHGHHVGGRRRGLGVREPAAQTALGCLGRARRQMETNDASLAPRDGAESQPRCRTRSNDV